MSISSMVDAKLVRETDTATKRSPNAVEKALGIKKLVDRPPTAANAGPKPVGVPSNVVDQLVRWIPTETLTVYVAYIAVADRPEIPQGKKLWDADFFWQWFGVSAGVALTVAFVVLLTLGKVRQTHEPFRWPVFEMVVGAVAFTAWSLALPDTPLLDFKDYKVEIGALLVTITTVFIAVLAYALGKQPPSAPVADGV